MRKENDLKYMQCQLDLAFDIVEKQARQIESMRKAINLRGMWKSLLVSVDNESNNKITGKEHKSSMSNSNPIFYDECAVAMTLLSAGTVEIISSATHVEKTDANQLNLSTMLSVLIDKVTHLNKNVNECKKSIKENRVLRERIHSLSAATKLLSDKLNQQNIGPNDDKRNSASSSDVVLSNHQVIPTTKTDKDSQIDHQNIFQSSSSQLTKKTQNNDNNQNIENNPPNRPVNPIKDCNNSNYTTGIEHKLTLRENHHSSTLA